MENLEALSDQELRVRLQQYGFANLPVTDTTRKVLVKKLRLAIEGQSTKNRRETVAVSKFSSDEEPEEPVKRGKTQNRRATVAVEKTKSLNALQVNGNGNVTTESSSKSLSRRSSASRATPSKDPVKPTVVAPLYPSLQEDTDDDIVEVVPVTRRSRTPPMGKSETVRTSYKTSVEVPEKHVEEPLEIDDEEFEIPAPRKPSPIASKTIHMKTITTSGYTSKTPDRATSSTFGRSSLSTSFNPRGKYNFVDEKKHDDDEKFELDETSTPYLSNFAKRLSTLRAEPLDAGMDKYKSTSVSDDYKTSSYQPVSYGYKTTAPVSRQPVRKSGFMKEIARIYDSLDRQYNFRTILYVVFIVMMIVAIFVIFM